MLTRADVCRLWQEKVKEHGWPAGTTAEVFVAALLAELDRKPKEHEPSDQCKCVQPIWSELPKGLIQCVACTGYAYTRDPLGRVVYATVKPMSDEDRMRDFFGGSFMGQPPEGA